MIKKFIGKVDFSEKLRKILDADVVQERLVMDNDFLTFFKKVFPERATSEWSPEMRNVIEEAIDALNGVNKVARAFPRGFGKTTTFTIGFSLWMLLTKRVDFVVLVGASLTWISEQIQNIQHELMNNENIHKYYGTIQGGDKWTSTEFILGGLHEDNKYEAKVLGIGRTGSVRGRLYKGRPKLVLLDDIEKLEETDNPALVDKTLRWVSNTILKMGDMTTRYFWLGTVLDKDCAFDRVLYGELGFFGKRYSGVTAWARRKDMWDKWGDYLKEDIKSGDKKLSLSETYYKKNKKKMMVGAKVLWKQHRPYKFLMYQFYTEGAASFFKEIQNEPKDVQSDYFSPISVTMPDIKKLVRFLSIDPSLGKITPSAIVCFGFDIHGSKSCYVFDQSTEKRGADAIIVKVIELLKKYDIHRYVVETIQFQDLFKDVLQTAIKKAGIQAIPIPFRSGEKKESRIEAMQPLINSGKIVFTQNVVGTELWSELNGYPHTRYLDAMDALSMGISFIKEQFTLSANRTSVPYVNNQLLYSRSYFDTIEKRGNKFGAKIQSLIAQKKALEAEEIKKIFDTEQNDENPKNERDANEG